ncbi:uncharacterized protein E0L32_001336 [Thyridium curvatum]|uniref:Uncharacterized protein n=1 Tax=Thyridium curvatum TaxID=1093900 RepID=A0A507AYN8_9PEZI|nr:uncharacterized protein E0L32_001336 [Thyridium curvatum]TPX10139.1 hypothetical protein E0L32_001336 [Thyridium curvatum]
MFLHAGASMHGHEFSNRRPSPSPLANNRRSPLLRAAFQPSNPRASLQLETQQQPPPRLRQRPLSEALPRGYSEPAVRFREPEVDATLAEPSMSEDESVQSASDASYLSDTTANTANTQRKKKRTRAPRKSTDFLFAHPAPNFRSKKPILRHIRPSLLLQLQQLSLERRPRPAIDVFPSTLIAGNVVAPRFWKKCPRLFGVKGELGVHDIILVRSEEYDSGQEDTDSDHDEERLSQRELIAVLSPIKREDRAEIVFANGAVWVAKPLPSGSYDFVHTDKNGLATTVRWARRAAKQFKSTPSWDSTASATLPAKASDLPEPRFTFSVIDPQSRRHPIMATLVSNKLEILDSYTTVSQSSSRYPPSRSMGRSLTTPATGVLPRTPSPTTSDNHSRFDELNSTLANSLPPSNQRTTHPISEEMKSLISVTAIWVALKQGWAPRYKYPSPSSDAAPGNMPSATGTPSRSSLTVSRHPGTKREDSFSTESRQSSSHDDRSNISDLAPSSGGHTLSFKRGRPRPVSLSLKPCTRSRDTSPASSVASPSSKRTLPKRTTSTGAAFMQRRVKSQISEANDTERATRGSKSRGRKAANGDHGTQVRDTAQGHQLGVPLHLNSSGSFISEEAAIGPLQVDRDLSSSASPSAVDVVADPSPYPDYHANYTIHMTSSDHDAALELGSVDGAHRPMRAAVDGPGHHDDKGARWRKLGNWFRRFGH